MEEVRLALSKKQHTSLFRGRKVRVSHRMNGTGVPYKVNPETVAKLLRAYEKAKGVDLHLDPLEIQASMRGGNLTNKLKRGAKILGFIGNEIYQPIAKAVAPVAKPIIGALTGLAVSKINNAADPTARYLNAGQKAADIFSGYHAPSRVAQGQTVDYLAKAAAASFIANSFNQYRPPVAPVAPAAYVGTYTSPVALLPNEHTLASEAMYGEGLHHRHLVGRGAVQAPTKLFSRQHAALLSDPYSIGFLQQLPGVFKDASRLASGRGLFF